MLNQCWLKIQNYGELPTKQDHLDNMLISDGEALYAIGFLVKFGLTRYFPLIYF
jgi:hypothetical protein